MATRSEELRKRHDKIVRWSLLVAVVAHVCVFLLWPSMTRSGGSSSGLDVTQVREHEGPYTRVDVLFGPPEIVGLDGTVSVEPQDRVLEARRAMRLPVGCAELGEEMRIPASGRVRLIVNESGHIDQVELVRGTGHACGDEAMMRVAGDLWYRWLPSAEHPAPVELVQPVTLTEARGP